MVQIISPGKTVVKIVPQNGELEITININLTVDGQLTANVDGASVHKKQVDPKDDQSFLLPDFTSGTKLNFGKDA